MPDSVFTQDQTVALEASYYEDYMNVYPFWDLMNRRGRVKSKAGDRCTVDYATNPPDVYSYGRDSNIEATQKGEMIRAYFDWGAVAMDTKEYGWDQENQGAVGQLSTGTLRKLMGHRMDLIKSPFFRRSNERLWQGAGTAYNGGDGIDFTGVEAQVPASPSAGTHGGLSRSVYDELQAQQIGGASGPSSDWEADAWERLLTLRVACWHPSSWRQQVDASTFVCYVTRASYVDIINLAYNQNTTLTTKVDDIVSVGGVVPRVNDAQDANTVYLLNPDTWYFYYPPGCRGPIEIETRTGLDGRMNPRDAIGIIRMKGMLVCEFPPQNGVITSAG